MMTLKLLEVRTQFEGNWGAYYPGAEPDESRFPGLYAPLDIVNVAQSITTDSIDLGENPEDELVAQWIRERFDAAAQQAGLAYSLGDPKPTGGGGTWGHAPADGSITFAFRVDDPSVPGEPYRRTYVPEEDGGSSGSAWYWILFTAVESEP